MNVSEDLLWAYVNHQCSAEEASHIQDYLVENPHKIIKLLEMMRLRLMEGLKLDNNNDPFKDMIGKAVSLINTPIANVRLNNVVEEIFSEKNYSENVPDTENLRIVDENKSKNTINMDKVNFNSKEFNSINVSARNMMDNINPEKSTLGNMVSFLLKERPEMSAEEATKTCRGLIEGVTNFNDMFNHLKTEDASEEETVEKIYEKCIETIEEKELAQQATILINFISFVKYADSQNFRNTLEGENAKELEEILAEHNVFEGEPTPEMIEELKKQLKDSIGSNSLVLTGEESLKELISATEGESSLIKQLAEKKISDTDFKAYASLAAYIACLKGEVEGCDENVSPELLGTSVAAGIERETIIEEAKAGRISVSKAVKWIKWIGGALLWGLFFWVTFKLTMLLISGTVLASVLLLGNSFLGITAGLIIGGFVGWKGANWFADKVVKPIVNGSGEIYDKIIAAFSGGNIIDCIKKGFTSFVDFLKRTLGGLKGSVQGMLNPNVSPA